MSAPHNLFQTLQDFELGNGQKGKFYSLPQLEKAGVGPVSKLPVSIRLVLESVLRNCDGKRVSEQNVRVLANWKPNAPRTEEIPFVVARIVLQDFTGVPLLVDLAAMRSAVARLGKNPKLIEPLVPVDLAYVVANYKETQLASVQRGQPVTISVDMYPGRRFRGHIDSLSPASGQEFALLPPDNATGNFTKVVQRIPVKIVLDPAQSPTEVLRPGMSVITTIDTKVANLSAATTLVRND